MSERESGWRPGPDEVRANVVRAGVELLATEGMSLGAERISLERAAAKARVSRAAAYKLWKDRPVSPGDAFRIDVLSYIAETVATGDDTEVETTVDAVGAVLEAAGPLEELDPDQRFEVLLDVIKAGSEANLAALRASPKWHLHVAILATYTSRANAPDSSAPGDDEIRAALARGADHAAVRYAPLYAGMASLFGLRLRAGYTIEAFATAAGALVEAVGLREGFSSWLRVTGPHDRGEWSLFAVGFLGFVREFFEPDPESPVATPIRP